MNWLAIDTSTEIATVALMVKGVLYQDEQQGVRQHALTLLPMIERLLATAALSLDKLDGLIFGRGPGSFTGLRIACSVVKGLAYALDLPVYPVSTLSAIANEVSVSLQEQTSPPGILVLLDARMNQVYWAYFEPGSVEAIESVTGAGDIMIPLDRPLIVAGVGLETYVGELPQAIQSRISETRVLYPSAVAMIRLVQSGVITAVSAAVAEPVYVRNQVTHVILRAGTILNF